MGTILFAIRLIPLILPVALIVGLLSHSTTGPDEFLEALWDFIVTVGLISFIGLLLAAKLDTWLPGFIKRRLTNGSNQSVPDWVALLLAGLAFFVLAYFYRSTTWYVAWWIAHFPITTTIAVVVGLISWNGLGGGVGLNDLFWNRKRFVQFFVGLFTGLLVCQSLLTVYLLWVFQSFDTPTFPSWIQTMVFGVEKWAGWKQGRPLEVGWFLLPFAALILLAVLYPFVFRPLSRWAVPIGAVAALFLFIQISQFFNDSDVQNSAKKFAPDKSLEQGAATSKTPSGKALDVEGPRLDAGSNEQTAGKQVFVYWWIITIGVIGLALIFFAFEYLPSVPPLPAILTLFTLLAVLNSVAGVLRLPLYWGAAVPPETIALMLVVLVVWSFLANRSPFKLWFPALESQYSNPVALPPLAPQPPQPPLISSTLVLQNALANWTQADKPAGLPAQPPLVILCVSGGGSRAGVLTCAVLEELRRQELLRRKANGLSQLGGLLVDRVRVITGASGGIAGAAYYAACEAFQHKGLETQADRVASEMNRWKERMKKPARASRAWAFSRDHLSRVVSTMLLYDIPWTLVPFRTFIVSFLRKVSDWEAWDRGRSLEKAWVVNTLPATADDGTQPPSPFEATFADLTDLEEKAQIPSIVYSPMLVEDARRLLISNLDLGELCQVRDQTGQLLSKPSIEFFKIFPNVRKTFGVSTAARMAASFPFLSPAVFLPTNPPRSVVDAGYYDNYGVDIAAEWVYNNALEISKLTSRVVFIEVRAYPTESDRLNIGNAGDGGSIRELSSPLSAVLTMRERSPWYRNDERLRGIGDLFAEKFGKPGFVLAKHIEYSGDAPLGWSMTEEQRDSIIDAAESEVRRVLNELNAQGFPWL